MSVDKIPWQMNISILRFKNRFRIGISAETACTENDKDLKQTGVTMTRKTSIQIKKYLQFEDKISCMTGCTTPQLKLNLCEQG